MLRKNIYVSFNISDAIEVGKVLVRLVLELYNKVN